MSEPTSEEGFFSFGIANWITIGFVVLGVASWLLARSITDSAVVLYGALIGVGVIAPTLVNEWRSES
ncbi:hypothetical protein L593_02620 [Salinarchaeum sp. Harcht-Bsk1]|uniref:hypothetical protein n=1 Tax=Salinarchaeum sp. Harcht-Bsk1 TaxID=1333523 RepID=UPI00034246D4|nr:hypothetical protein [Salinarchaeum sp. Harcht-Bsk1]AGN00475.1 hypothetical protein L593_02620 [Salinarchaeum sp. Harcht-Bsk1]